MSATFSGRKSQNKKSAGWVRVFGAAILVTLVCAPLLFSQVNTGRILGTITDQTGGVIAGAMVTVTNTGTGVARTLTTNQSGEYSAPDLTPGTYSVRVSDMGFQAFERQNITMGVGQAGRVDAQLMPGQVTQTVEVTAAAPLINTTNAVVSNTLEAQTISNLPMNGRNFNNLLTLQVGVVASPGGGTLTTARMASNRRITTTYTKDSMAMTHTAGRVSPIQPCPSVTRPPSCPPMPSRNSTSKRMPPPNSAAGPAPSSTSASSPARTPFMARPSPLAAMAPGMPGTLSIRHLLTPPSLLSWSNMELP